MGDLLRDLRRVNVAFSRAKAKLLVVCSRRTLEADALFARFFDMARERGWVCGGATAAVACAPSLTPTLPAAQLLSLPPDAHTHYPDLLADPAASERAE